MMNCETLLSFQGSAHMLPFSMVEQDFPCLYCSNFQHIPLLMYFSPCTAVNFSSLSISTYILPVSCLRAQTKFYPKFYLQCLPHSPTILSDCLLLLLSGTLGISPSALGAAFWTFPGEFHKHTPSHLPLRGLLPVLLVFSPDDTKGHPNEKFLRSLTWYFISP